MYKHRSLDLCVAALHLSYLISVRVMCVFSLLLMLKAKNYKSKKLFSSVTVILNKVLAQRVEISVTLSPWVQVGFFCVSARVNQGSRIHLLSSVPSAKVVFVCLPNWHVGLSFFTRDLTCASCNGSVEF